MLKILCPAKINFSLQVTGKRDDGYHNLEMTLAPVSIYDEVSLEKKENGIISVESFPYGPLDEENLCFRAARYFFSKTGISGGIHIKISKEFLIKKFLKMKK